MLLGGVGLSGAASAATSGDGYTCTTQSDGTLNCVGTKGPDGSDNSDDSGGSGDSSSAGSGTGLLSGLTGWLSAAMTNMWNAVAAFFKDLVVSAVGAVLSLFASMVEAIPVPDFIANFNMSQILGSAGSDLGYFMGVLQISKGMAALGAGYAFRLLRKFLTLFQW